LAEPTLPFLSMGFSVILVGIASYTDLRWRRIPNVLTFPAIGCGLVLYVVTGGWEGLLLSLSGALLAPSMLSLVHGGKGPGMGDIKMAAALGAILGPTLGVMAMLLGVIVGGVGVVLWVSAEWGMFGDLWLINWMGRLFGRSRSEPAPERKEVSGVAIPYGVALAIGTLLTLVVCLWTGKEQWYWPAIVVAKL
jgi:prepilin peptidase CpaA